MEETLELMTTQISDTKLNDQILFMESLNSIITTPITIAILNSLKELKGIKQNKIKQIKL